MNKRKLLTLAMSLIMVTILAVGGTLAYFTDFDEKTNVFTIGDVKIHIDEWMEDGDDEGDEWDKYEDQELHPIAQDKAPANKLVETVNDGSEDAYIRTFITCPTELYWELGYGFNAGPNAKDGTAMNGTGTMHYLDKWSDIGEANIGTEEEPEWVHIFMCEHYDPIPEGDSILSLTKVWVYDHVDNADIDGEFEVKVYSEAIQSENLTYAEAMESLNNDETVLAHATGLFK